MPDPLLSTCGFHIERREKTSDYAMPLMSAAFDHYTISYLISGDRETTTPKCIYSTHTGDVGLAPPYLYHRTTPLSTLPYESIMIKYTYDMVVPLINRIGKPAFDELYSSYVCHFTPDSQKKIHTMFCDMLEEFTHFNADTAFILQGMLHRLLLTIIKERLQDSVSNKHMMPMNKQIIEAIHYIETHFNENPSLEQVAAHVFLSPTYFSKLFKKQIGSTYSTYLDYKRLQQALFLLSHEHLSIGEIAEKVGYSNGNYFCDVFKKYYQVSPSEFRKQLFLTSHKTSKI